MNIKKLLLLAFIIGLTSLKAQTTPLKALLLQDFDETKIRKELKKRGLNPEEYLDNMRRKYMSQKAKQLGFIQPNTASVASKNNGGSSHEAVFTSVCSNSGFEQQNFTGWSGTTGTVNIQDTWTLTPTTVNGIVTFTPQPFNSPLAENGLLGGVNGIGTTFYNNNFIQKPTKNRHNIMTAPAINNNPGSPAFSGYDSMAINPTTHLSEIPVVSPNGSGTSLRLGNANTGSETESITYSISVNNSNTLFTYQFAVVLNNPAGTHNSDEQPFFSIIARDQNGTPVGGPCGTYNVNTDQAVSDPTFVENPGDQYTDSLDILYKKWTTVSIDLSNYIGQTVTITFSTYDCSIGGHFGYAYLDAFCGSVASVGNTPGSVIGFCGGNMGTVTFNAPPGFASWQWEGPNNNTPIPGATSQSYTATNAHLNDTFTVKVISVTGCPSFFKLVVKPATINTIPFSLPTCLGGATGIAATPVINGGSYTFSWMGASGALSTTTDTIKNLAAGTYSVHIVDASGSCAPKDTTVTITSAHPGLQTTTSPLCGAIATLNAPAGSVYNWYDNFNNATSVTTQTYAVTNGANNQYYTVTYTNPNTQCKDSLKISLLEFNIGFTPQASPTCNGGNNGSLTYYPASGNAFTNFDWSFTNGTTTSTGTNVQTPINIANLAAGTYTMAINVTGNSTCTETLSSSVVVSTGATPVTTIPKNVCNYDTLTINPGVTNSTHSWSGPGISYPTTTTTLNINTPFTNTVTAFYTYVDSIKNNNGNCLSIYKEIIALKSFKATLTAIEKLKCFHDSTGKIKALATEVNGPINTPDAYTFTWLPASSVPAPSITTGTGSGSSSSKSNLKAGTFTCVITNGNCAETATLTLADGALLHTDSLYAYYCPKDSLALLVANEGNTNYLWYYNGVAITGSANLDSIKVPTQNINNVYVIYKHGGCKDTAKTIISTATYNAFRPSELVTVFSPNGDKVNDFFFPFYMANNSQYEIGKQAAVYELKVYDRWGKLCYETTDYSKPWDGKTKSGHEADNGTYFYIVKYQSNCSTKADLEEKKGFVELVK